MSLFKKTTLINEGGEKMKKTLVSILIASVLIASSMAPAFATG